MSDPLGPAGWHPDPTGRYEYRYFNGQQWTGDVSTHGQRFIDSGGPPTSQHERGPSRGMAIAAFVVGLLALFLSWIPFVFVLGGAGAITAFVFGVLGTRAAARNQRYGQGYAIAGIVLSVLALAMCTVGFLFTRVVLREVNAYLDPGPHEVSITVCDMGPQTGLHMEGTIRNDDTKSHRYEVTVEYRFASGTAANENINVPTVDPGSTATFTSRLAIVRTGALQCRVTAVYGPTPFNASTG